MFLVSCKTIVILLAIFAVFLYQGYLDDCAQLEKIKQNAASCPACRLVESGAGLTDPHVFHNAVLETVKLERFAESKVKRILIATRDQVLRGIIMGAVEGSAVAALHGALTWSLTSGIVLGVSEMFNWKPKWI